VFLPRRGSNAVPFFPLVFLRVQSCVPAVSLLHVVAYTQSHALHSLFHLLHSVTFQWEMNLIFTFLARLKIRLIWHGCCSSDANCNVGVRAGMPGDGARTRWWPASSFIHCGTSIRRSRPEIALLSRKKKIVLPFVPPLESGHTTTTLPPTPYPAPPYATLHTQLLGSRSDRGRVVRSGCGCRVESVR
jgi:hypothetical protein